jgi:hypothetical protein
MYPPDPKPDSNPNSNNQKYSLLVEIARGWEWVIFSFKVLSRIGGPIAIAKTIANFIKILASRTIKQWGFKSK